LIGKSRPEVAAMLGPAEIRGVTSEIRYQLRQEFDALDPIAGDDLVLRFDNLSRVEHAEIVKWKRR
jgi:hypothetical protein